MSAGLWSLSRSAADGQGAGATAGGDEIRRASDEWFEALRKSDIATIDRLEADDFLTIQEAEAGVAVIEKGTQLSSLKSAKGTSVRLRRDLSNVRIRHYADSAILTAVAIFRRDDAVQQARGNRAVVTEVWVRQNNRWRIAHFATHPVRDRIKR